MARAPVGLWLLTDAPRGAEILQLLADAYGIDGIAPDDNGHARLYIEPPDDIPAYLAVMGTLESCARDWETYITVFKLAA